MRALSRPFTIRRPTEAQLTQISRLSSRLGIEEPRVHTAADARKVLNRLEDHRSMRDQLTLESVR